MRWTPKKKLELIKLSETLTGEERAELFLTYETSEEELNEWKALLNLDKGRPRALRTTRLYDYREHTPLRRPYSRSRRIPP